ncbi:MAG: zinc ribbon domain-containing protein [Lachnospiraceae bacterium]|nr:zinc ribbon domain-containing protein [Lachnospiraceae bacterium]
MFCTSCGSQVPDDANVCPNCGKPLRAAAPQSGGSQVDLSGVTNAFKTFKYTAIDNLLSLIGCGLALLGVCLPFIHGGGTSYWLFSVPKVAGSGFYIFQGILLIFLSLGGAFLLITNLEKLYILVSFVVSLVFMTEFTTAASAGFFDTSHIGLYVLFAGAGLMVTGSIMKILKHWK